MSGYGDTNNGSIVSQSMAGFFARSKSAELDYKTRSVMVSRARILQMSSTIARAAVATLLRGVIGSGLKLEAEDNGIKRGFELNSTLHGFDYDGELDIYQLQQQVFETMLISGECWLFRVVGEDGFTSWKVREPDHISNPLFLTIAPDGHYYYKKHRIIDGVEMDNDGRPRFVWFCADPYSVAIYDRKNWERIPLTASDGMPNILHIYKPDRAGYPRGVPLIAPVIDLIWSTLAYTESEIQMGILQSCSAYVVKTNSSLRSLDPFKGLSNADLDAPLIGGAAPSNDANDYNNEFSLIQPPNPSAYDGALSTTSFIRAGCSHHLAPNEEVQMLQPTAPSTNLEAFYKLVITQVGAALGIPAQCLSGNYEASYSAAKASFSDFSHTVGVYRKFFIDKLLKPIYKVWLFEALKHGTSSVESIQVAGYKEQWKLATVSAMGSQWRSLDKELLLDETKTLDYYIKAIEAGLIERGTVADILFGVSK